MTRTIVDAHRLTATEVLAALETDTYRGLSVEEARARLARDGRNELPPQASVPGWRRFVAQFKDVLVILLLIATVVSVAVWLYERDSALPYEAIAIFAVVLLNAIMGFAQEARAESAAAALRAMSARGATVIRGGEQRRVLAAELVAGDLVRIEEGDTIPADARVIGATALLQVLVVYLVPLQKAFGTTGLTSIDWMRCGAAASMVLCVSEVVKIVRRRASPVR